MVGASGPGAQPREPRTSRRLARAGWLAFAAAAAFGCAPRPADRGAAAAAGAGDTLAAARAPGPAGRVGPAARGAGAAAESVCAAVAAWWRKDTTVTVRATDSLLTPWQGDTAVAACVVAAREEHGLKRDAGPDTTTASLGVGTTLARATGAGWFELVRFMADGPDGSSSRFQRGPVRCAVEASWDGGDDSDPSYVPDDWYEETMACWAVPGGVAVSDTAP